MQLARLYLRQPSRPAAPLAQAGSPTALVFDALHELAALGHPDRIARFLNERHCRGAQADRLRCVLASHITATTAAPVVLVSYNVTESYEGSTYENGKMIDHMRAIENPVEVRAFLWRFDHGYYPQLEALGSLTKKDVVLMWEAQ